MNKITIFNTWVSSENTGDKIIMEACQENIVPMFQNSIFVEMPTHTKMNIQSHKTMDESYLGIVCGSNLLKPNMLYKPLWKINFLDTYFMNNAVLMGVGWSSYSQKTNLYTKLMWRRILSKDYIHSVRDEYTKQKLNEIGINNVIVTTCPTMWKLTPQHCEEIPNTKAKDVVTTVTNYNRDNKADNQMFNILSENYETVYIWPQSYEDILYLEDLTIPSNSKIIAPNLDSFNEILKKEIDYVGTRLHAGIRAMQYGKRTIIIGIDNRAIEKEKYGIKVVKRDVIESLDDLIKSPFKTELSIPFDNIKKWKQQFQDKKLRKGRKNSLFKITDSLKRNAKKLLKR